MKALVFVEQRNGRFVTLPTAVRQQRSVQVGGQYLQFDSSSSALSKFASKSSTKWLPFG